MPDTPTPTDGADITAAICLLLNTVYGFDAWPEEEKQGFKEPCFFVRLIRATHDPIRGQLYARKNLFAVQYFPAKDEPRFSCYKVQSDLFLLLEYITVGGGTLRGTKMHGEVTDDVLNFFVNYDFHVRKLLNETLMEELEVPDIRTKG